MKTAMWHGQPMAKDHIIDPRKLAIGRRIAAARERKGLSQADLATILGITSGAVGQYETGRNLPKLARFEAISGSCDVTVEWLLTGDDPDELRKAQTVNEAEALRLIRSLPADKQQSALAMLLGLAEPRKPAD